MTIIVSFLYCTPNLHILTIIKGLFLLHFTLFSIGKYHDQVLCDVVPMYDSYILLGKPWKIDRRANYDNFKNSFSSMKDKKIITLVPLTPK